jgi:hypothetical protein
MRVEGGEGVTATDHKKAMMILNKNGTRLGRALDVGQGSGKFKENVYVHSLGKHKISMLHLCKSLEDGPR